MARSGTWPCGRCVSISPNGYRFGFVGKDSTTMWQWRRTGMVDLDTERTRALPPDTLSV
jgi:hypothetical protein